MSTEHLDVPSPELVEACRRVLEEFFPGEAHLADAAVPLAQFALASAQEGSVDFRQSSEVADQALRLLKNGAG